MKYYFLTFLFATIIFSCKENEKKETTIKAASPAYQLATVTKGGVDNVVKLPAQLVAYQEVSIYPKVNGYVKNVLVDIGSKVSQGDVLMILEAPELIDAALQAKEKYTKAKVDVAIDKERYSRLQEAAKTLGAISPLDISTIKAKTEADEALCNAEKDNWQMQETMLGYLKVTAPFSGIITERNVNPGALVSATTKDKPLLELKEESQLRLQVDIPEALANNLKNKDSINFYVDALQGKKLTGYINRSSKNINSQFRSERMEIDVNNKNGLLTPGMFANVEIFSKGDSSAMIVPKTAVVISTERKYVLVVDGMKIKKVDVTTGNSSNNKIEIFGALKPGYTVIAVANDEISEKEN